MTKQAHNYQQHNNSCWFDASSTLTDHHDITSDITVASNKRHCVWNHQKLDSLYNGSFGLAAKKTWKFRFTDLLGAEFTGGRWIPFTQQE